MSIDLTEKLRIFLADRCADLVGFADIRNLPEQTRNGFSSGIIVGKSLNPKTVNKLADGPFESYAKEYKLLNSELDKITSSCAEYLEGSGFRAQSIVASGADWDEVSLSTPLPHKTLATLAGAGWIGKCALLITKEFGSAVRLGSILTDAELICGTPIEESKCGKCTDCIDACPASAPTGTNWQQSTSRPDLFDASACFDVVKELSSSADLDVLICGICINACPWTKAFINRFLKRSSNS